MNEFINRIIQNPLFLQLKNTIENNAYHNHEGAYSHSIKTKDIALEAIKGDFITNIEVRQEFLKFINENFYGMKRAEIMVLIALVHDIGKVLYVKEGDRTRPLLISDPSGNTMCPGHEYWGSTIVNQVLKDLPLNKEIIDYIKGVIKLHDTFNESYFAVKTNWPLDLLMNDVKSRAEGLYKEALFNVYCDCYALIPYQSAKEMVVRIFNEQSLYQERQYLIGGNSK